MNCIKISQTQNKIIIKIDEHAEQIDILEDLTKKMKELKKMYKNEDTPIYVSGKVLKNKEIEEIQKTIKSEINVEIEFDSPKVLGLHGIKKAFEQEINSSETKFYRGSLRSGKKIEYEGSIVIIGDVNGGAEVISGENIVVLGNLRGLAHAGAKGNKSAIIAAEAMDTAQIRIANIVKELEKEETERRHVYIYVKENEIIIE